MFALSTDYGVFLLGRIKEARDGGLPDAEAVATGLARTGRVVTAAAILMAVAIGAFSTSSISFIQQIGVATATGVLVDAFVVRTLLVPSLMTLLGPLELVVAARRCAACTRRIGLREGPRLGRTMTAPCCDRLARSPTLRRLAPGGGAAADPGGRGAADRQGPGRDRVRARRRGRRLPAARAARRGSASSRWRRC